MKVSFRYIARGICIHNGSVLLCKSLHKENYFLPGGGLKSGETPVDCFIREIFEEINQNAQQIKRIGRRWAYWYEDRIMHFERNYLFLYQLDFKNRVESVESHIKFEWMELNKLDSLDVRPAFVKKIINHLR